MVSTLVEITDGSPSLTMIQATVKTPSASKSLCFSSKYLMSKRKLISIVLELGNQNVEQLKLEPACGIIKQNKKWIQKLMVRLNISFINK